MRPRKIRAPIVSKKRGLTRSHEDCKGWAGSVGTVLQRDPARPVVAFHWSVQGHSRAAHAADAAHAPLDLAINGGQLLGRIAAQRGMDVDHHAAFGTEAEVLILQIAQRPQHQPRAGQQDQGKRHLRLDQQPLSTGRGVGGRTPNAAQAPPPGRRAKPSTRAPRRRSRRSPWRAGARSPSRAARACCRSAQSARRGRSDGAARRCRPSRKRCRARRRAPRWSAIRSGSAGSAAREALPERCGWKPARGLPPLAPTTDWCPTCRL